MPCVHSYIHQYKYLVPFLDHYKHNYYLRFDNILKHFQILVCLGFYEQTKEFRAMIETTTGVMKK